jgi:NADPH:quinone reductase-like Zn-dependent oxidoreductase
MGHRAITTCSPKNLALARRCGADEILDYNSPTCSADIKHLTRNSLKYVVDPFADIKTTVLCLNAMGRAGGRYCALEGLPGVEEVAKIKRNTVKRQVVIGAAILGAGVIRIGDGAADSGVSVPSLSESNELTAWGIQFFHSVQRLLDERRLKGHPTRLLNPTGERPFHAILEGLELLKQKRVSGEKLVVRMKM